MAALLEQQLQTNRLLSIALLALSVKPDVVSDAFDDPPRVEHPDRPAGDREEPKSKAQPIAALAAFIARHGD